MSWAPRSPPTVPRQGRNDHETHCLGSGVSVQVQAIEIDLPAGPGPLTQERGCLAWVGLATECRGPYGKSLAEVTHEDVDVNLTVFAYRVPEEGKEAAALGDPAPLGYIPGKGSGAGGTGSRWRELWTLAWGRASEESSPMNDGLLRPKRTLGHPHQCMGGA